MTISPRTEAMIQGPGGTPDDLFEEGFRELSLTQLMNSMPELAEQISAFKVLEANTETSSAVGTFIILRGDDEIHVPAVLAENDLHPFDMMYVKSLDVFLPLTPAWLMELERMDAARLGSAQPTPPNLSSDQDIRNVVVPPTTGRYSYASSGERKFLPAYLSEAHDMVKESFLKTLDAHPKIAQYVFENYDHADLKEAVRPRQVKVAGAGAASTDVSFVTIETPVQETRSLFSGDTEGAIQSIAEKGYAAKDTRTDFNEVIATNEGPLRLQSPSDTGFYRVYLADGTSPRALIFTNVKDLDATGVSKNLHTRAKRDETSDAPRTVTLNGGNVIQSGHPRYPVETESKMVVTDDGRTFYTSDDFIAEALDLAEVPEALKKLVTKPRPRTPRNGQRGFFCRPSGGRIRALEPFKVEYVTLKDGSRHIKASTFTGGRVNITQIKDSPITEPKAFSSSGSDHLSSEPSYVFRTQEESKDYAGSEDRGVILVPWDYNFVPIDELGDAQDLLDTPEAVMGLFRDVMSRCGAESVRLKNAGAGQISIGYETYSEFEAIEKLARVYRLRVPAAEEAVKFAQQTYNSAEFFIASPQTLQKVAHYKRAQEGPPPEGGMPPGPEGEMPVGPDGMPMGPPQEMMMPPEPPMPNPLEIAAQEIMQQVMQNNQDVQTQLITQQQSLDTQMGVLNAVVERANQVAAEMQGMNAGPPVMAPQAAMPPAPQGGMGPQQGGMPMGPPPQGMGPQQGGMPMGPGAGQAVEEPISMEQAMDLQDPELFDSAAIGTLAEQNDFDKSVAMFIPTFRETIDSLGRLLLDIRMKANDLKQRLGEQVYSELLEKSETIFASLGEMLIRLNETVVGDPGEVS